MSDVSKTNELIVAKLRKVAKQAEWYQALDPKLLTAAADALEAATRVPVQGEPTDDREALIDVVKRNRHVVKRMSDGYPSVVFVTDETIADAILAAGFSRAAVPDAAPQKQPTFEEIGEDIARGIRDSLSGVAPQESSRLPDFFAPKPMPNDYIPVPQEPNQNETKSGQNLVSGAPSEAQWDFGSSCLWCDPDHRGPSYSEFKHGQRHALTAAGVAPQPVIDEAALTEVIGKVTDLWDEPLDEVHDIPQIARAVAAWLKDGAKR